MARKVKKRGVWLPEKRHEVGTKPIVLIDGMNFAYRAFYAFSKLKHNRDGKHIPTSLYYGFPELIKTMLFETCSRAEKVIVFWDGQKHPKRMEVWPEYKSHRKPRPKKLNDMLPKVMKMLYYMGIPQAIHPDVEGDDMAYLLVRHYIVFNRIQIVSDDKDFDQLVNNDVCTYCPRKKHITVPGLCPAHNYGLTVDQLVDFYCLTGDKSDDIKGYPGIGDVRAVQFLNKYGLIRDYLKNKRAEFPGLSNRKKLKRIWKRNRLLIDLKYFNERYNKDKEILWYKDKSDPAFNEQKFKDFCYRYGLKRFTIPKFIEYIKSWNNE